MRYGLTAKQNELLDFIQRSTDANGYSPSFQEMADALGYRSKSSIYRLLEILRSRGHVRQYEGAARSVVVTTENETESQVIERLEQENMRLRRQIIKLREGNRVAA
jgi:repressor LexA